MLISVPLDPSIINFLLHKMNNLESMVFFFPVLTLFTLKHMQLTLSVLAEATKIKNKKTTASSYPQRQVPIYLMVLKEKKKLFLNGAASISGGRVFVV